MEIPEAVYLMAHLYQTVVRPAQNTDYKHRTGCDLGMYEIPKETADGPVSTTNQEGGNSK